MPLTLKAATGPVMPSANGEGPYDAVSIDSMDSVDNRYRVRQAGHLSSLSDALGFTYGAYRIVYWGSPNQDFGLESNGFTEHDQNQPAVAGEAEGGSVIAWSSYGQDGDLGGIVARRFDRSLASLDDEILVNEISLGHQSRPQVAFDAHGTFVVAWETEGTNDVPSMISFRRFSSSGSPLGGEVLVDAEADTLLRLVGLAVEPLGTVSVDWSVRDQTGAELGIRRQRFDPTDRAFRGSGETPP